MLIIALLAWAVSPDPSSAQGSGSDWETDSDYTGTNGATGAARQVPLPALQPGQHPRIDSVEAGLWMQVDRMEQSLRRSGRIVTDPGLNHYVRGIVCRLAPEHCADIRVYIVQTPNFNASMAANGMMQIWTGLLLRCQNEAQFAYILGHELGHYLRRHSLQRWRNVRNTADAAIFFSMLTAAAGFGFVGDLGQLIALGSIFAYSRDQEREADQIGFDRMRAAGYDPREAAKTWQGLLEERKQEGDSPSFGFFSTHPATDQRVSTLAAKAAALDPAATQMIAAERFNAATAPFRATWLREDIGQRWFARSEVVLQRLIDGGTEPGQIRFFQGEIYRLRQNEGDEDRAVSAYLDAIKLGTGPPETHRSLGLVYWSGAKIDAAKTSFLRYLAAKPGADDREIVEQYINEIE